MNYGAHVEQIFELTPGYNSSYFFVVLGGWEVSQFREMLIPNTCPTASFKVKSSQVSDLTHPCQTSQLLV